MNFSFRRVSDDDSEVVTAIFNYFVENSFAAYPEKKVEHDFFEALREMARDYPFYVIETEDNEFIGFGLLHRYNRMDAFKHVGKVTYFISPSQTRKGLGKKLLDTLVEQAKKMVLTAFSSAQVPCYDTPCDSNCHIYRPVDVL